MRVFDYKILRHIFTIQEEKFRPLLQDELLLELYNKYSEAMHEALHSLEGHVALPYKWFSGESLSQKVESLEEAYDTTTKTVRPMGKNSEKYPDLVPVPQPPPEETKKDKKPRQKRKKKEPRNVTKKKTSKESKRPKLTESLPPPPPPSAPEPSPSALPLEDVQPPIPAIEGKAPEPPQEQQQQQQQQPLYKDEGAKIKENEDLDMALEIERQLQEFYDQMCAGMQKLTIHEEH